MNYLDEDITEDDELNAEAEATRAEIAKRVADALGTCPMPEGVGPLYAQYVTVAAVVQILGDLLVMVVASDHDAARARTWGAETVANLQRRIAATATVRTH